MKHRINRLTDPLKRYFKYGDDLLSLRAGARKIHSQMFGVRIRQRRTSNSEIKPGEYLRWLRQHSDPSKDTKYQARGNNIFILILPIGSDKESELDTTLNTLFSQIYQCWELVIVQTNPWERTRLNKFIELQKKDKRIRLLDASHDVDISSRLSQFLAKSPGQWVVFIGAGDVLAVEALAELVLYLDRNPDIAMVYSDEDMIDQDGNRHSPYFKPHWSPDLLLSHNYIGRLVAYRKDILLHMGDISTAASSLDEYEMALHFTEFTGQIGHIPKILYSRRESIIEPEAEGVRAVLSKAMERRGESVCFEPVVGYPGYFRAHWLLAENPLISIVICTKDKPLLLQKCLTSIFRQAGYSNLEILLIDNGSTEAATFSLYRQWQENEPARLRIETFKEPFNFSTMNNWATELAKGDLLLFLNNDTEVLTPDWLQEMAGQACRPEIGAVGAMLLFPNGTIQHAGIILGGKSLAVHSHRGMDSSSPGYKGRLLAQSNVSAVTAACLMIRKELFSSLGGFNERFVVSYGDVDLCLRLRSAGYQQIVLPQVRLLHSESSTRGYDYGSKKRARLSNEASYLISLHPQLVDGDPFYNANLSPDKGDFSLNLK
jgi:GT2 family glycosyltransferase